MAGYWLPRPGVRRRWATCAAILAGLGVWLSGQPLAQAGQPSDGRLDVRHYRLELRIDPAARQLRGVATLRLRPPTSGAFALDLARPMVADAVTLGGAPVAYEQEGDALRIHGGPARAGSAVEVVVAYHGSPQGRGFSFAEREGQPAVSSFGMPSAARQWWPSHDDPADKAEDGADIVITVPPPLTAASNGRLVETRTDPDGWRSFHWRVSYPIYADTVSVAAARYVQFADSYRAGDGTLMPLQYFVFPADEAKARRDFSVLPDMMASHVSRFGEYPFLREKYGIAEFATFSFREHQTLPSYAEKLITGDHANDDILAHELAHQWFGNSLTVRDWRHIWLNESFSTYAALLWRERRAGAGAYRDALGKLDDGDLEGPVFIADAADTRKLFGTATFQKGPWVLHMLRHVMGDAKFFAALRDYVSAYSYRTVKTEDFRSVCERRYGRSLKWFFDQWVYGVSRPSYQAGWTNGDASRPGTITITQLQTGAGVFVMPIDVEVATPSGPRRFTVWNSARRQTFPIPGAAGYAPITTVRIDPDGWILKRLGPAPSD